VVDKKFDAVQVFNLQSRFKCVSIAHTEGLIILFRSINLFPIVKFIIIEKSQLTNEVKKTTFLLLIRKTWVI
jgi:hypothetical protein